MQSSPKGTALGLIASESKFEEICYLITPDSRMNNIDEIRRVGQEGKDINKPLKNHDTALSYMRLRTTINCGN